MRYNCDTPLTLTIPGTIRSKKNSKRPVTVPSKNRTKIFMQTRRGLQPCRIILLPSAAYVKWEKAARQSVAEQLPRGFALIEGPVWIKALFHVKGRLPDLSGAQESLGDCLEGVIYEDDRQVISWDGSRVIHDKSHPRVEVRVFDASCHPIFQSPTNKYTCERRGGAIVESYYDE